MLDWNKAVLLGAESIVVMVLGVCVMLGHNSAVTDGLLAASGLIVGGGLLTNVPKIKK